jgi:3-hydroxyacyl-[acyl-carrier-protein] dehydratase
MTIRAEDILDRLPHRPPFRFITDKIDLPGDDTGKAVWRIAGDEPFFEGHFPGAPIVPGVLVGEALAQLSGLIVAKRRDSPSTALLDAGDRASPASGKLAHIDLRFSAAVVPPAEIELVSRLERTMGALWHFEVVACASDRRVARGVLTLAIAETSGQAPAVES